MDLVPVLSCGNDSKKYDGKIWWEEWSNIVEVNGNPVTENLKSSSLKGGDSVLVKFGSKAKKTFKGIVQLESENKSPIHRPSPIFPEEDTAVGKKKAKLSLPVKTKGNSPARKGLPETKS